MPSQFTWLGFCFAQNHHNSELTILESSKNIIGIEIKASDSLFGCNLCSREAIDAITEAVLDPGL
jgi:hypothetical protein